MKIPYFLICSDQAQSPAETVGVIPNHRHQQCCIHRHFLFVPRELLNIHETNALPLFLLRVYENRCEGERFGISTIPGRLAGVHVPPERSRVHSFDLVFKGAAFSGSPGAVFIGQLNCSALGGF